MAATFRVDVAHGSGPTLNAWPAGGRYHRGDSDPVVDGSTTFIPIPTINENYSWRKYQKLNVLTTPVGSISNLRWFTDGVSWGTGVTLYAGKTADYVQASSIDNTAQVSGTVDAVTNYTSASPLVVNAGTVLSSPATGYGTQDYVVTQVGVGTTAEAGTTGARTLTYRVDES